MKYKRLLLLITSLIFITALVCCFFTMFKTAEINVSASQIENSSEDILSLSTSSLEKYHKKNLVFINKANIKSELESLSGYISVDKIEKKFPNKLNIKISERKEAYAIKLSNKYAIVDNNYVIIKIKDENVCNIDSLPLIEFKVNIADYDETHINEGKSFLLYDEKINSVLKTLSPFISARRENVKSIAVNVRSDGKLNRFLSFKMTEGVEIQIDKVDEFSEDKLLKLFDYYDSLENKGDIQKKYVTKLDGGEIVVLG